MHIDFDDALESLAAVTAGDVLFLLACSDRKIDSDAVPLRELYDGPTWQTLRTHGSHILDSQIIVLSGKYGWTGAGMFSKPYNERISPQKVDLLIERGASIQERIKGMVVGWTPAQLATRAHSNMAPWKAVVICGGELYRRAFNALIPDLKTLGLVDPDAPTITTSGGIGEQRSQLGQILRATDPDLRPTPSFRLGM